MGKYKAIRRWGRPVQPKQPSELNAFAQQLFGTNTNGSTNEPVNPDTGGREANWVLQGSAEQGIPTGATIAVRTSDYLTGSIRYPGGTYSNWTLSVDDHFCGAGGERKNLFSTPTILARAEAQLGTYPVTDKYPLSSFADYAALVPNAIIHSIVNTYSQTAAEAIVGIDKLKALIGADRLVHWEMVNEITSYPQYVNDVANAGSFPNLSGDLLTLARQIFPNYLNGITHAENIKIVSAHVRENYPNDKIGVVSNYIGRWSRPDGTASGFIAAETQHKKWAAEVISVLSEADYDAVIIHPYMNFITITWGSLAASAIPSSGKMLDATFSDQADKFWRFTMCVAERFMNSVVEDKNQYWPKSKELWLTEWGNLVNPVTAGAELNQPDELDDAVSGAQHFWRMLYVASTLISMAESHIKWLDKGGITTTMFHAHGRGASESNEFYTSGYKNANGVALGIFTEAVKDMTHMSVPVLNDSGVQFLGQAQYALNKFHPVRGVYFEDGATQRLYLINVTPNDRTVKHAFAAANTWAISEGSLTPNPFTDIPDHTIPGTGYQDMSDYDTGTEANDTYTCPAFSVTLLENTGAYVDLNNSVVTVT